MSTIFKIIRIIFLVLVALTFSRMNTSEEDPLFAKTACGSENEGKKTRVSCKVPWFIIGFFLFTIINSTGVVPLPISRTAKFVSSQFEIIALAAIGMRVKFRDLLREGPKAMLYGGCVGLMQTVLAVTLIGVLF